MFISVCVFCLMTVFHTLCCSVHCNMDGTCSLSSAWCVLFAGVCDIRCFLNANNEEKKTKHQELNFFYYCT